jgi:shikimate kinase
MDVIFQSQRADEEDDLERSGRLRQRLADLIAQRERLYAELADITLDTADQPISHVLQHLLPLLRATQSQEPSC